MCIIGHTDQGDGRADGVQIMIHKGHAYVGHIFPKGFSVIVPGKMDSAGIQRLHAGEDFYHCGLAGTVLAEQGDDLGAVHTQTHAVEDAGAPELLGHLQ
jgi:hypothetical protein